MTGRIGRAGFNAVWMMGVVVDERIAGLPTLRAEGILHTTTLDDHERRLDAIEAKG
jgi:hypothetical protein